MTSKLIQQRSAARVEHLGQVTAGVQGGLIWRSPHPQATQAGHDVLRAFPRHLLRALAGCGAHIWLLDHRESPTSVPLPPRVARLRWHGGAIGLAECAGVTLPTDLGPLVIAPWHDAIVLRHELGHALGAVLDEQQRRHLARAHARAAAMGRWLAPLAARSVGEYLACGAAFYARPGGPLRLACWDGPLAKLLEALWSNPRSNRDRSPVDLLAAGKLSARRSDGQRPDRQLEVI